MPTNLEQKDKPEVAEVDKPTKLDEILLGLENQPKFYKAIACKEDCVMLCTPRLSEQEKNELLGSNYLNFKDNPGTWNKQTALLGFRGQAYHSRDGTVQLHFFWKPESPNTPADPNSISMTRLNEDVKLRRSNIESNITIANRAGQEARTAFEEMNHRSLTPAVEAVIKLRIHLALRDGGGHCRRPNNPGYTCRGDRIRKGGTN